MSEVTKNTILVVDDNKNWLSTISIILETDYDLTLVTDHRQALKLLKASTFDLVILDKQLLGVSGLDVFRQMREIRPDIRIIMLTGYADVDSAVEIMKIGAFDYLNKGTRDLSSELRTRVKEALDLEVAHTPRQTDSSTGDILTLISKGESSELEFKSTARWDVRANKINKELERVIAKTVAALLNSEEGGTLLIGVDDDGHVLGLEHDYKTLGKKRNRDAYENFLTTLLLSNIGRECSPLIKIGFYEVEGRDICRIDAKPSSTPQFVKDDKGEHFFIRAGNSTRMLSTKEALGYCKLRFS